MACIVVTAASLLTLGSIIALPYWVGMFIRQIQEESRQRDYVSVVFRKTTGVCPGPPCPYCRFSRITRTSFSASSGLEICPFTPAAVLRSPRTAHGRLDVSVHETGFEPRRCARGAPGGRHPAKATYTVRNTMMIIAAKPTISVGAKTVPSMSALVTAAEMGSMVAIMLARMPPRSLMPCI